MGKAFLFLLMLTVSAGAIDKAGQDRYTVLSDYLSDLYDEVAGFTTAKSRICDSTWAKRLINSACLELAQQYCVAERDTVIAITAGTDSYNLPSDFCHIDFVKAKGKNSGKEEGINEIEPESYGLHRDDTGIPQFWMIDKGKIWIVPTNTTGDTVRVSYCATSNILSALTDTSNVDIDFRYMVRLTAAELFYRGKYLDPNKVVPAKMEFIANMKDREDKRLERIGKSYIEMITK